MKRIITIILAAAMVFTLSACNKNSTESASTANVDSTPEEDSTQEVASTENETEQNESGLSFDQYVEDGVLTEEEATSLVEYLEANIPEPGTTTDPLVTAVEEGIITQEQADALEGSLTPPDQEMGQEGSSTGPMVNMDDMMSVDDANEIEAKLLADAGYEAAVGGYPIVDTNETTFYSNDAIIDAPAEGESFYGQDASYTGNQPSYTDNGDGTITDNVTGLMWQQDPGEKMDWTTAVEELDSFELAGYDDWRIPTIKELYSLVQFSGKTGTSSDTSIPYIDTDYFVFEYGDAAGENRFIDSQILTSTIFDSTTLGGYTTTFGYNFADGRIKGYEITKNFYCYHVRGNTNYGQNLFVDNGDETITDEATGLMWMQNDSGYYEAGSNSDGTMDWEEALEWAENATYGGYDDWRLPNVKELQSIVDYTKSPYTTNSPAIDDLFYCSPVVNSFGEDDYGYYWSGTTHNDGSASEIQYGAASYVVFGMAKGYMDGEEVEAHGSGSQKSDPKTGSREDYPAVDENAPQGDEQRVFNMVRLVRDAE
jgi:hypothetical protein